jgi:hypothetical protein
MVNIAAQPSTEQTARGMKHWATATHNLANGNNLGMEMNSGETAITLQDTAGWKIDQLTKELQAKTVPPMPYGDALKIVLDSYPALKAEWANDAFFPNWTT